jgi:hypothetical protein
MLQRGREDPTVAMEMACRRDTTQSSSQNGKNMKIFEGLSNSRNMVFNVKKLLNVGVGLTLRRKSGKN